MAALGVGGIGFAFAAQNTLENLFGSVTVVLDRPFSVGDWVQIDGVDGSVEEVGLRIDARPHLLQLLGQHPERQTDHRYRRQLRRTQLPKVQSNSWPAVRNKPRTSGSVVCSGVKALVMDRTDTRKDVCYVELNSFGDSSLNVLLYMFFDCETWADELRGRHELMLDILQLGQGLGVEFAFPTQTLHIVDQALAGDRPTAFEAITDAAAQQLGTAKAKEIGGRGCSIR